MSRQASSHTGPSSLWALLITIALGACGGRTGVDDAWFGNGGRATPSMGGASGTGGQRPTAGAAAACPGSGGPRMVRLNEGYCVDSTEVTRANYQAWLATNPSVRDQDQTDCGWNSSFVPDASCLSLPDVCQGSACDSHPQVCVDWCDAYAYCRSVGQRMCGKIGGGTNGFNDDGNPALSQWHNACSSHGQNSYPYGSVYDAQACNGWELGIGTTLPVASLTGCQSGVPSYSGVYDLDGNVWEWEDSCSDTGETADCRLRGGSYLSRSYALPCATSGRAERTTHVGTVGIRCCSP